MAEIFKAYDIRGIYGEDLNADIAYKLGRAFVTFLKVKEVVIGYDMRETSPILFDALAKGINDQGANVINIGMCTTPMLYFGISNYNHESGIMITASHNSKEYNGFKLCREQAIPISGATGIQDLKELVLKNDFESVEKKGIITTKEISKDYSDNILSEFKDLNLDFKILVDAGNAMGSLDIPILKKAGLDVDGLFLELDGNFPNHEANPLKTETLNDIKSKLENNSYALGIAFDGDADRCSFLTETGEIVGNDYSTAIIAEALLKEGDSGLFDVRSSKVVGEVITSLGATPVNSRIGHAFIKETMRERDIIFGGELSGHYYFKKMAYCESAVLAALYMLKIMKETGKPLSELIKPLKKYSQSGEINFKVEDKLSVLEKIKTNYSNFKQYEIDGLTIESNDWWFNLRLSNTEPVMRLNLEADTEELLTEKLAEVKALIEN